MRPAVLGDDHQLAKGALIFGKYGRRTLEVMSGPNGGPKGHLKRRRGQEEQPRSHHLPVQLSGRHCEQVERQRPFADAQQAVANPKEQLLQPCFAIPPALGISESPEELWIKS